MYLTAHQADAQSYSGLKAALVEAHRYHIEAYRGGKDALVKEIERKAIAWQLAER